MQYEVHFLTEGEEQRLVVEANDAAEAASMVQTDIGRTSESFELLSVHPLNEEPHPSIDHAAPESQPTH